VLALQLYITLGLCYYINDYCFYLMRYYSSSIDQRESCNITAMPLLLFHRQQMTPSRDTNKRYRCTTTNWYQSYQSWYVFVLVRLYWINQVLALSVFSPAMGINLICTSKS